jgi:hypothetical protein
MSDPTYNSVKIRQATAGAVEDLLTLDAVDGSAGNGAALSFINNSAVDGLHLTIGRISARRVDATSVQLDLAIASDPTVSSSDDTPPALSLVRGAGGVRVATPASSTLVVGGTLEVAGATTLGGMLSVAGATTLNSDVQINGNVAVSGTVDGRKLANDGTRLDQHLARTDNPHATTAAQVGALAINGGSLSGSLTVSGSLSVGVGASADRPLNIQAAEPSQELISFKNPAGQTIWHINQNLGGANSGLNVAETGVADGRLFIQAGGNVGIGTANPTTKLDVSGVVRAGTFEATNPLRHRMYPADPLVYQDIFDAKAAGAIAKLGNPRYDETSYSVTLWLERRLIKYGTNNEADGNGALVTVPDGYDTVWVRVLGDRWTVIHAYFLDGQQEDLGLWTGGYRGLNCYCPDGSLSDGCFFVRDGGNRTAHQWVSIPVRRAGQLALIAKPTTTDEFWVSGLAFSKNPWANVTQSAVGYHWAVNGGNSVKWNTHDWNQDVLAEIVAKTAWELKVPVISSGRDKLLYLIEHNNNWNGCMHAGITVNNQPIERFTATYDNPFARHWNSKTFERYIAARIPASLIPADARWLSVRIDMSKQGNSIAFREIGTHDLDTPWG